MTDDDAYEAHRDGVAMYPHHNDAHDGATRRPAPIAGAYCDTCGLFHGADVVCGVAKAAVEASIMVAGEVVTLEEIGDVDRPALERALALRGLALEPADAPYHWRVIGTVAA